jgi:integrase
MPLSDLSIKNARPGPKVVRLYDTGGLYLELSTAGSKLWRLKYRYDNKEKRLALGSYPETSLKEARQKRDSARKLLSDDIDPGAHRKAQKAARQKDVADSFEIVAREWFDKFSQNWVENHANRIIRRLEYNIFPWLGSDRIAEISAPRLLAVIRRIEQRGALETAHRALANCGQVFRYAIATGRAERDPTGDLRGALPPVRGKHFSAVTEPEKVAKLLRTIDRYDGTLVVGCALRLAPYVFVRPGELRNAKWADIDLDRAEWRYQVTKTDTAHIVPLAKQALRILHEIKGLTGSGDYVFPSARSRFRPMSDNAILAAMRRMGIDKEEMSGHGFRATARTILDEVLGFRPDLIEHQLAHAVRDPNGRAYNRTAHLPERKIMMQRWADYLDELKSADP